MGLRLKTIFKELFGNLHHVEVHQAGVLVLVLLRQMQKPVLLVEGNGRKVGINGDEAEGGVGGTLMEQILHNIHESPSNLLTTIVF